MFWKSKPKFKLPKTASELNYRMEFLRKLAPTEWEHPNAFSFAHNYPDELAKDDAQDLFRLIKHHMNLTDENIQLDFFWETPLESKDPSQFLDTAELYKTERLTIGEYQQDESGFTIRLGMTTLKNTSKLVFILAHELAHYKLLGQEELFFNDEILTDILALAHGFGRYWLHGQNWKDYFSTEYLGYLKREEGLFVLARLMALRSHSVDFDSLPSHCLPFFKEAIIKSETYTETVVPYTVQSLQTFFSQNAANSKRNDPAKRNIKNVDALFAYNNWVSKGRSVQFKKKHPNFETTVTDFLANEKKWILMETVTLEKNERQLQLLSQLKEFESIADILTIWRERLNACIDTINQQHHNYNNNRPIHLEAVFKLHTEYKLNKIKDLHTFVLKEHYGDGADLPV